MAFDKALREPSVDNSSRNHISPGKSWNALASEHLYLLFQSTFLRRIRLQPEVFFIVRSRLLPLVTALERNSSVVVSDGIFCVKLYGLGEVGYCFVELPLLAVGFAPEVVESTRGAAGAPVPRRVAMGSSATTYSPCSITIRTGAGRIALKSEQ